MSSSAFSSLPQILAQKARVCPAGTQQSGCRGKVLECPILAVVEKDPEKQRMLPKVSLGWGGGPALSFAAQSPAANPKA